MESPISGDLVQRMLSYVDVVMVEDKEGKKVRWS